MGLHQSQLRIGELESVFPPLKALLRDERVTEIMVVSGASGVRLYYERLGRTHEQSLEDIDFRRLESLCFAIARPLGLNPDKKPLLDARLADGSRVAICVAPATPYPSVTIRRFGTHQFTGADLVEMGSLPQSVLDRLADALRGRGNVLVSGGTGSGKTTLLNALIQLFPADDRIIVVEDIIELKVTQLNVVRLEARDLDRYQLSSRDMVKHSLRHRPDHIVIGEIRGPEAQDVLQALNTGHGGSMTTIHANNAKDALTRIACCAKQADDDYPWEILCQLVSMAFNLVVHQSRLPNGGRGVTELIRVDGYDRAGADWKVENVWSREEEEAKAAAGVPPVRAPRGMVTVPGHGEVSVPVVGAPRPPDVADPATVPPPGRIGDASVMVVQRWPRRKVERVADSAQHRRRQPEGNPRRVLVNTPGVAVPRELILEQGSGPGVRPPVPDSVRSSHGLAHVGVPLGSAPVSRNGQLAEQLDE